MKMEETESRKGAGERHPIPCLLACTAARYRRSFSKRVGAPSACCAAQNCWLLEPHRRMSLHMRWRGGAGGHLKLRRNERCTQERMRARQAPTHLKHRQNSTPERVAVGLPQVHLQRLGVALAAAHERHVAAQVGAPHLGGGAAGDGGLGEPA